MDVATSDKRENDEKSRSFNHGREKSRPFRAEMNRAVCFQSYVCVTLALLLCSMGLVPKNTCPSE